MPLFFNLFGGASFRRTFIVHANHLVGCEYFGCKNIFFAQIFLSCAWSGRAILRLHQWVSLTLPKWDLQAFSGWKPSANKCRGCFNIWIRIKKSKKGSGRLQINAWPIDQMIRIKIIKIRINIRTKTQDRYHDHYIRMRKRLCIRNRIKARMAPLSKSWHRFNKCMAWEPHLNAAKVLMTVDKVSPFLHLPLYPRCLQWNTRNLNQPGQ